MILWVVGASIVVAVFAVTGVLTAETISLAREGPILHVRLRRGRSPDAPYLFTGSLDMGEGVITYFLIVGLAWLSALSVANSSWVRQSDGLPMVAVLGTVVAIVLAKLSPRATTFWLAAEVSAVAALFIATATHTGWRVDRDFITWVLGVRASLQLALLVAMVASTWLACAWLAFWTVRTRNVPVALAPMVVVLTVEVLDDPGQKGLTLLLALWIAVAAALAVRVHLASLDRRWGSQASDEVSMSLGVHAARVLVVILVLAFILLPPLSRTDLSAKLWAGQKNSQGQN
ncbi:MAG: hypothetical protein M3O87_02265, partial [Candidatus Dormibacteraeota bacterium]|nr:hypothetical protein [Candidatus Dormibacteraeota bacterium]